MNLYTTNPVTDNKEQATPKGGKCIYKPVGKAQVYEQLTTSINNGFIHICEYCYRGICKDNN